MTDKPERVSAQICATTDGRVALRLGDADQTVLLFSPTFALSLAADLIVAARMSPDCPVTQ